MSWLAWPGLADKSIIVRHLPCGSTLSTTACIKEFSASLRVCGGSASSSPNCFLDFWIRHGMDNRKQRLQG